MLSRFTTSVRTETGADVFLFHTLTDAVAVVSDDVYQACLVGRSPGDVTPEDAVALDDARHTLQRLGFLVESADEDDRALDEFFSEVKHARDELRVTVLTTLRCNMSCDYCVQGAHVSTAPHMTREMADRVGAWIAERLDTVKPARLVVTFFGGEPLLNVAALERVAALACTAARQRDVEIALVLVTNGLLLSRPLVERLVPLGLRTVKVTLDGDAATHDLARPTCGGRGTFELILENLRSIAGLCGISIGGNVGSDASDACVRLMDQIAVESFRPSLTSLSFKPIVATTPKVIPLADHSGCGTGAKGSQCDSCGFADQRWAWLREQAIARGLPTPDGIHMGPCEIHRSHAHTVGPDGRLYACPGYAGREPFAVGHVSRDPHPPEQEMQARRERLSAWRACGDCSFVPVCAGGCAVAASFELGNMDAPACHRPAFEAALVTFAKLTTQEASS